MVICRMLYTDVSHALKGVRRGDGKVGHEPDYDGVGELLYCFARGVFIIPMHGVASMLSIIHRAR